MVVGTGAGGGMRVAFGRDGGGGVGGRGGCLKYF